MRYAHTYLFGCQSATSAVKRENGLVAQIQPRCDGLTTRPLAHEHDHPNTAWIHTAFQSRVQGVIFRSEPSRNDFKAPLHNVVGRAANGETVESRLRHDARGLRLELSAGSYDLLAMLDEGWQIVGTKTYAAERLLRAPGCLPSAIDRLPRAHRCHWRRSLRNEPDEGISHQASA